MIFHLSSLPLILFAGLAILLVDANLLSSVNSDGHLRLLQRFVRVEDEKVEV